MLSATIRNVDREARKSDDLLKREFRFAEPFKKCITDITEIRAKDRRIYASAIFDCYGVAVLDLAMNTNIKAVLFECIFAILSSLIRRLGEQSSTPTGVHSVLVRFHMVVIKYVILQSMNNDGESCHNNVWCESMWVWMKEELKTLIWRYFISYWSTRRICFANEGLPPMVKRQRYYEFLGSAV